MTATIRRLVVPLAVLAAVGLALTGCSGSGSADGKVTITVGGEPTSDKTADLKVFKKTVADFEKANPDIDVKPSTTTYDVKTFQALVASGRLPDVFYVPFTDIQALISRGQVADLTSALKSDSQAAKINPTIQKVAQADGKTYGVPIGAYSMGLLYNRGLFEKAGLDPDSPPTTWDEVRADAKQITEKTGVQGFGSMTKDNTGGWILTTMSYSFGGRVESENGKRATVDNPATKKALEFYRDLRWEDDSFGSNFLVGYDDAMKTFAAGKMGMFVQGADAYQTEVITNGMPKDDFGLAPLPQSSGGLGTLGGGTISILSPKASPEQVKAGLKWIEYQNFQKYFDEDTAVAQAKATAADGSAVGAPGLQLFGSSVNDRYLGWVKDYINVPRENYTAYLDSAEKLALVPEPATAGQEVYSTLDNVVQAVLTKQGTDIDDQLSSAQKQVQSIITNG